MLDDDALRQDLLARIEARRSGVYQFLHTNRPGIRRRTNITIVMSSLAALFTVGPAVGGENFSVGIQHALRLHSDSYVWRVLCLAAVLVSAGAAVLTNLSKSNEDAVAKLTSAESAKAELEGLSTLIQFGHLSLDDAVKLFYDYSAKIAFIDDAPLSVPGATGRAAR
jgi:hypothetical protein